MNSVRKIFSTDRGGHVSPDRVREELSRILGSPDFKASARRREMLVFLVEELLAGRGHELKGYTIGVAVFRRGEDFDAQSDPVVRLEARRLRRDLDGYYVAAGRGNPLRISIPTGNYAPDVQLAQSEAPGPLESLSDGGPTVATDQPASGPIAGAETAGRFSGNGRWPAVCAVAAGLMLVASAAYVHFAGWRDSAASQPRGSALLMLPFKVYGESSDAAFLAAGISEQLMADLRRFPDILLYLPTGQGTLDDPVGAGDRAGASFVLTGSVKAAASRMMIGAQLVHVDSGRIAWAEQFDRSPSPGTLLSVQSEIGAAISTALGQPYGILRTEITSALPAGFEPSMSSYECVLRAYAYRRSFATALHAPVLACLEAAVKSDPDYAEAWAMLGWLYLDQGRFDLNPEGSATLSYGRALDAASHAVALDGTNVLALKALASINHYMGSYDEGEVIQRRALALNPNDPDTLAQLGWRMAVRGKFEEGIPYLQQAIDRTVNAPGWYFHLVAVDHYLHGRYAEMLDAAKRSAVDGSGISWSFIAIAHGALGNDAGAHEALARMAEISPLLGSDPAAAYRRHHATDEIVNALVAGLRNAGWTPPGTN
ncbi:tetratricopeptide repeat protein [Kumtagia ephedrae]|nr:tetratricopeptide repeat protein [Mesorhizobium ephedrae]